MGEKLLRLILLMLPLPALFGCNLQTKMLYYPGTYVPTQEALASENLEFWPAAADDYRGFAGSTGAKGVKGTIIVFHGNAGTASDRAYYVKALAPLGYRVILAEYPAYGSREGKPGEAVFVKDAQETMRLAFEKYGKPVYLMGESLGCGVAAAAARNSPVPIEGIILFTPWDTLLSVAKEKMPWFFPVRLFMKDKYDSVGNLKAFQGRIAIVGAERDEIIPIHHAMGLYESLPGNKKMWILKGVEHNDWPKAAAASFWKEIMEFVENNLL